MPSRTTGRRRPPGSCRGSAGALLALLLGACASGGGRAPVAEAGPGVCHPPGGAAARPGTLTVAVPGRVDPLQAPLPTSDAERVLFRQLYATLVRVDCEGRIRPGLAESWSTGADGTRWTFRLDPEARFADGSRVRAADVVAAWHATDVVAGSGGRSPLDGASVSAVSERTVVVTRDDPHPTPAAFAAPRFAVAGSDGRTAWPLPSGTHRPAAADGSDLPGRTIGLAPVPGRASASRLRLVALAGAEARDLVDAGTDVLVTRDPSAAGYAAAARDYRVHALPWDRTWTLLVPGPTADDGEPERWDEVRRGLASGAIPAESRPADPAAAAGGCPAPTGRSPAGRTSAAPGAARDPSAAAGADDGTPHPPSGGPSRERGAIVYPGGEPSGRALAARLAALAGGAGPGGTAVLRILRPGRSTVRTEGLAAAAFRRSLREGRAGAYLLALPRATLDPCRARRSLLRRAPWLRDGGRVVPLVDTRALLVLRRTVAGLGLDWDGTPRFGGAGRP